MCLQGQAAQTGSGNCREHHYHGNPQGTSSSLEGSPGRLRGRPADKDQRRDKQARYLTMSHFHCSPSGQKLLTPSRYRRALCSVSAHTTLFRAVTWDSGYGQSTFMALAQGRSTLRPAGEMNRKLQTHTITLSYLTVTFTYFSFWYFAIFLCNKGFLKDLVSPWLGGSIGWSIIPHTERMQV